MKVPVLLLATLLTLPAASAVPEGFRVDTVAYVHGFLTSVTTSPDGTIHYTTRRGEIRRITNGIEDRLVTTVDTANVGNAALLGMAFAPDGSMIVHYVEPGLQADIISSIDPETLEETILTRIPCSPTLDCSSEHRGGNPWVSPEGVIFVGLGDYGVQSLAQKGSSNAGKIHRIAPDGEHSLFANGLRNPFDLAWDPYGDRMVVSDNGPIREDEVNLARTGDNLGWPMTMGNGLPIEGTLSPAWVFEHTVVPTGLVVTGPELDHFGRGILMTTFIAGTLFYFPDLHEVDTALPPPIAVVTEGLGGLIDVTVGPRGEIYVASMSAIYQLIGPQLGDVDGNGKVEALDYFALRAELNDGDGNRVFDVGNGTYPGTWGADLNQDRIVDESDLTMLASMVLGRRRGVRR